MSAYRIILIVAVLVIVMFVWIVFNETVADLGGTLNGMLNASADADTIARNNTAVSIFYWSLLVIIMAAGIWILKSSLEKDEGVPQYA